MTSNPTTGQRGPIEHARREQIIVAAEEHFRHYGYRKTTVADLAKAIGLSTAYVYKFFESKQAIGEAICTLFQGRIAAEMQIIAASQKPASERLRKIFRGLAQRGAELFFQDRKLHDIAAESFEQKWQSGQVNEAIILEIVQRIVREGREAGEFERKTPFAETCRAIMLALQPIRNPILLEQNLDTLDEDAIAIANLVLRSLVN